ncbi:MAG TPA: diguanylate cyclase [Candidatus Cloacimonetes bacterium]|nr:diguanylate cyclase [Candidatus Cloacimonadota bacterium]HEX37583.1 diguanylate cyclase [Candidatus Cloacimonadota bacterium]
MNKLPITVLYVEDEHIILQSVKDILEGRVRKLFLATNGKEALELFKEHMPDVIITDIKMPGIDGLDLLRAVKKIKPDTKLVILTAFGKKNYLMDAITIGVDKFILKPVEEKSYLNELKDLAQTIKLEKQLKLEEERRIKAQEELEEANKRLSRLARTDPLTGLSNRRDIYDKLDYEIKRFERNDKPFSIAIGDIDEFKSINDNYGHDAGDFILFSIAHHMRAILRKQDIVGRWGGEEFIFIFPETNIEGAQIVAEKVRKAVENKIMIYKEFKISLTITIGVATYDQMQTITECIKKADTALYNGKQKGKNCVVTYSQS